MGLGGNTPDTPAAFAAARAVLASLLEEVRFSSLYRSLPLVDTNQDPFWNAAATGLWAGTPETLLERLLMSESAAGRIRDPRRPKGPRVLDLDLLAAGTLVRSSPRLILPHPGIPSRRFVLEPLVELTPAGPEGTGLWAGLLTGLGGQGVDRTGRTW